MSRRLSFAVAALLVGVPAYAQDNAAEIDRIFAWATPNVPGCVVAVSQHGEMVVNRAYGLADLERGVPLSTGSIFDAASIRKQFVAADDVARLPTGSEAGLKGWPNSESTARKRFPVLRDRDHASGHVRRGPG